MAKLTRCVEYWQEIDQKASSIRSAMYVQVLDRQALKGRESLSPLVLPCLCVAD